MATTSTLSTLGSDVIQATIVNDLLNADLVLVDLTEHNPNVLFELGLRISQQKPTVLVKASGTNDFRRRAPSAGRVIQPKRVAEHSEEDLPKLTAHTKGAWESRDTQATYMSILRADTVSVA
ncbi:hypothetical protein [Micropruina sp.]|uniref:hypothetical protein n=1 Tax=Micropruina sp. TaxID=2737536 RepID=UPI0039E4D355